MKIKREAMTNHKIINKHVMYNKNLTDSNNRKFYQFKYYRTFAMFNRTDKNTIPLNYITQQTNNHQRKIAKKKSV